MIKILHAGPQPSISSPGSLLAIPLRDDSIVTLYLYGWPAASSNMVKRLMSCFGPTAFGSTPPRMMLRWVGSPPVEIHMGIKDSEGRLFLVKLSGQVLSSKEDIMRWRSSALSVLGQSSTATCCRVVIDRVDVEPRHSGAEYIPHSLSDMNVTALEFGGWSIATVMEVLMELMKSARLCPNLTSLSFRNSEGRNFRFLAELMLQLIDQRENLVI